MFKPHVKYAVCRLNASLTTREGELHGIVTLCLSAILGDWVWATRFSKALLLEEALMIATGRQTCRLSSRQQLSARTFARSSLLARPCCTPAASAAAQHLPPALRARARRRTPLPIRASAAAAAAAGASPRKMKYVLVTGGVVSGLGKGVTASSVGVLLKNCGFRVTSIKIGKRSRPCTAPVGAALQMFAWQACTS